MTSSRFAVAVHLISLALLAKGEPGGELRTSERMAQRVGSHPVVVRRILGALREAGLVASRPGPGGGWRLARAPERIRLLDVYRAVEREPVLALPHRPPHACCPLGSTMRRTLGGILREAESALEGKLAEVTVADVLDAVLADGVPCADAPSGTRVRHV